MRTLLLRSRYLVAVFGILLLISCTSTTVTPTATIRIYTPEGKTYTLAQTIGKSEVAQFVTIPGFEVPAERVFARKETRAVSKQNDKTYAQYK